MLNSNVKLYKNCIYIYRYKRSSIFFSFHFRILFLLFIPCFHFGIFIGSWLLFLQLGVVSLTFLVALFWCFRFINLLGFHGYLRLFRRNGFVLLIFLFFYFFFDHLIIGCHLLLVFFLLLYIDFTASHALNMTLSFFPSISSPKDVHFSEYICQQLLRAKCLILITPIFSSDLASEGSFVVIG